MQVNKPIFWDKKKPNLLAKVLKIFSSFFVFISNFQIKKTKITGIKTICVGNIYLGGTGKTPTCIYINKLLKDLGYRATFIKKLYKNQLDEQLLFKKNGNLICKKKRLDGIKIAKSKKFNFAICDDGLQDKKIEYNLKIVCFNAKLAAGNGLVFPAGPLREKLENLKKYHAVIINGNGESTKKFKSNLKRFNKNLKIFEGKYTLDQKIKKFKNKKFIAFSGVGNNLSFLKTLKKNNLKIIKQYNFPDHYNYTYRDIKSIKKEAKILKSNIITTEKDFLRLNKKNQKNIDFIKIKIKINNEKSFKNYLKKI